MRMPLMLAAACDVSIQTRLTGPLLAAAQQPQQLTCTSDLFRSLPISPFGNANSRHIPLPKLTYRRKQPVSTVITDGTPVDTPVEGLTVAPKTFKEPPQSYR